MYKDKLIEVLSEKFSEGKISEKKFDNLVEKVILASEATAKKAYNKVVTKELITEITSRTWDEFWFSPTGAKIKVALNKKYQNCKSSCIGGDASRKNYCVEKCRHEYYKALEKNRANIKED